MSAISPSLDHTQHDPFSVSSFHSAISKKWKWLVRIYHHHSDLITSLGIFTLNTILLASKIFKEIPHLLHRSCYTALSFSSVMWLNIAIRDLIKNGEDLYHNLKAKDLEGIVFSAAKVTVKSLNMILSGALIAASIFSLFAFPEIALAMYAVMRPFSLFSLAVGILNEVYDYKKSDSLADRITQVSQKPEKVERVMRHFLKRLYHEKDSEAESPEKSLARHAFKQLDHYLLESMLENITKKYGDKSAEILIETLDRQEINSLIQTLEAGLKQKRQYTQANLGLIGAGYVSMGICKIWPDSLIQSSVTWAMSLLYTSKMIWQKYTAPKWNANAR